MSASSTKTLRYFWFLDIIYLLFSDLTIAVNYFIVLLPIASSDNSSQRLQFAWPEFNDHDEIQHSFSGRKSILNETNESSWFCNTLTCETFPILCMWSATPTTTVSSIFTNKKTDSENLQWRLTYAVESRCRVNKAAVQLGTQHMPSTCICGSLLNTRNDTRRWWITTTGKQVIRGT